MDRLEKQHYGNSNSLAGLAGRNSGRSVGVDSLAQQCEASVNREMEIPLRVATLHKEIEYLSERVASLGARLASVSTVTPHVDKGETQVSVTGLGGEMADMICKLRLITQAVNDLAGSIEL